VHSQPCADEIRTFVAIARNAASTAQRSSNIAGNPAAFLSPGPRDTDASDATV